MNSRLVSTAISMLLSVLVAVFIWPTPSLSTEMSTRNRIKIKKRSYLQPATAEDSEEYSAEKMEVLASKRRSLILDIKRFLRDARDGEQKAELNLRLGALYMEDYHSNLAKAQQAYEKASKTQKNVKFDNSDAMASLDKARAIYHDLLQRYPNHPRRDEMYYFLAISSLDRSKTDEAMTYFQALSEKTPDSRYINDALVQLGDYYFDTNRFSQALPYYDKILAKRYPALAPYAKYKKAWCEYNSGHASAALALFKSVIDDPAEDESNSIRIRGEAMKDITLPFVDLKKVDESIAFFKAAGEPNTRRGLETMAALYYEAGDYKNAINLYQDLLQSDPNHVKNPSYDLSIIDSYKMLHQDDVAVNRLFTDLPNYLLTSNWREINAGNPKAIADATMQFEELTWRYSTEYHAQAQRTKNEDLYNMAKKLYVKYLEVFPNSERVTKIRFQLAEILYHQGQYMAAADHYFQVYKGTSTASFKADAIKSSLMSLDRQLNLERKKEGLGEINSKSGSKLKDSEDTELALAPYKDVESAFLSISEEYLTNYSSAKDAADIIYESAYLQYLHHDFVKSYKNFWTLVQRFPKHETVYASTYLILDILNRKKDYERLVAASKKFLENSNLTRPEYRKEVADILRHGELKKIQVAENGDDYKEAASAYMEYTKNYGRQDDSLFEKALYNASVNYTKANDFVAAAEVAEQFLRRFPKSSLREQTLLQVAKSYELFSNYEKAASYYEQFAKDYSTKPQAKSALRLAGLYYWGAGNVDKAEGTMLSYMKLHPEDRLLEERDLLDLYESEGSADKLIRYYLGVRSTRGLAASDYLAYTLKIAEIQAKRSGSIQPRLMEEGLKTTQRFEKQLMETPKGREAIAKLRFWYLTQTENTFHNIKLELPQSSLEKNLQRKLALLKSLESEYASVASLGIGEWGLGAMYRTAQIYHEMADDVKQAPIPSELTAEQVDLYRDQIGKSFIKPFSEKAMAMAEQCLDKSQELEILSSWTPKCYSIAAEIDPLRYPLVRTFYLPSVELALMAPKQSKVPVGSLKQYAYPFFSFGMFNTSETRSTASTGDISLLYGDNKIQSEEAPGVIPTAFSYRVLTDERRSILASALKAETPEESKNPSLAYLNLLRLMNPEKAVPSILSAIQKDPQNQSLHNLLGLAYLQIGKYPAAKVTWLSMIASGNKSGALLNNLGVLATMEGRESQALDYFTEAAATDTPKEALDNIGFVALKYRSGFQAKKKFEQSLTYGKDEVISKVGYAVALIQNREMEAGKDKLVELTQHYKTDPYSRLSLAYYFLDIDKENNLAAQVLGEYLERQNADGDIQFRQAIEETKRQRAQAAPSGELPNIQ